MKNQEPRREGNTTGFEPRSNSVSFALSSRRDVARTSGGFVRIIVMIVLAVVVVIGGAYAFKVRNDQQSNKIAVQPSDNYAVQSIPLGALINPDSVGLNTLQSLSINGQLRANNSLVIAPTDKPSQGTLGQIYYDKNGNVLAYYDGVKFVNLAGTDEVAQLRTQVEALRGSIPQLPTIPQGIATQPGNNTFTGSNAFTGSLNASTLTLSGASLLQSTLTVNGAANLSSVSASSLSVSGATTLGAASASSLLLSSALPVGSGGTGTTAFTSNGVVIGQGSGALTTVNAAGAGLCLVSTAGAPVFQACPGGGGSAVDSLNGLTGAVTITNSSNSGQSIVIDNAAYASKGIASFNAANFNVVAGAVNTIQGISVSDTPTFNGLTLTANLGIGANSIVTSAATISSAELNVLDNGIDESEVTGVITDVTAGNGLTGGAATGNATLNIASANGGIAINANDIALTLQPAGDGLSATASSGSGLEILSGGLSLLQGCNDGQILKWNEATDTWGCSDDAGGSGLGDDVYVSGTPVNGANFINTVVSGTTAGVTWGLNTTPSPDDISITVSNASATDAGVVTTGIQAFAGDKTFNNALTVSGLFTANGGVTIQAGDTLSVNGDNITDLTGTGLVVVGGLLQASLGTAIDSSEITDLTITGTDIADDTIALGTKTTGNYAAGNTAGTGIAVTGAAGEGWSPTISLDYSSDLTTNTLGVNQSSFAAAGILFEGSTADSFETLFTLADPTADNTIILPNASGTVCLTTGNCAGSGSGVTTGGGTTNRIAKFTGSQAVNDSTITDDGTNVTTSVNLVIQGGNVTAGTNSQLGSFILNDGNGQTTTLRAGDSASNLTFILPTSAGNQFQCLKYDTAGQLIWDDCSGGAGGGTGVTSLNSLTGGVTIQGSSQIGVSALSPNINLSINANSIGDSELAFDTGQNLTSTSAPTFAGLTLNGDLTVGTNSIVTGLANISSSELEVLDGGINESEVTGVITDVTAGTGLSGGAAAGNATLNLADTTVTSGSYGSASTVATFTVDAQGRLTAAGNASIAIDASQITTGSLTDAQISDTLTVGASGSVADGALSSNVTLQGNVFNGANQLVKLDASTQLPGVSGALLTSLNGSAISSGSVADTYVANDLTVSNLGNVDWSALNNYPAACNPGEAITALGDTPTCQAFAASSGSGNYIQNGTAAQNAANFNIQSSAIGNVTAKLRAIAGQTADVLQVRDSTDTTSVFAVNANGDVTATSFSGNGANLTALSGSNISTGTVANARLVNGGALTVSGGSGLTGGGSTALGGSTTLNIASANGGIVVNADDIALTLQPSGDGLSATTSSGSGMEILSGGFALLQGCSDGEILKWNETTDTWGCAADAGGSGLGDDIYVGGLAATNANFANTAVSGTTAGVTWNLNTLPTPDDITLTISNASATDAGVVTTGIQSFSGVKTFGSQIVTSGGIDLGTQTLQGTTGVIDFTNFDVLANGNTTVGGTLTVNSTSTFNGNITIGTNSIVTSATTISSTELDVLDSGINESEVTGVITDVTAGNGLTGGAAAGNATLNVTSANGGIVVNADNIALTLQPSGDALSATTSSGSGLEILSGGFALLQGCADNQLLKWNETTDTWGCGDDAGGSGLGDDVYINGTTATNANFINSVASGTSASVTWSLNTTPAPDEISIVIGNASATEAGAVTTGSQTFAGAKTFSGQIAANGGINLGAQTLQGTSAVIDFTNFDVAANGATTVSNLTVNGTSTLNDNVTVAANKTLTLVGGTTLNRPAGTEGQIYFDTTTKQLLVFANGKWQADRESNSKIIAPSDASQAAKDSADVVLTGTADQTLINTALTAAAGGKVYLMEGTISLTAAISIPNNTTLAGAGAGTLITVPNAQNGSYRMITNTTGGGNGTNIAIQDLRIDGNKANQTSGSMNGIYLNGVGSGTGASAIPGAKITGVRVHDMYGVTAAGININASDNNTITGNTTQGNGMGITLATSSDNNTIISNTAQGNTSYGININASDNNTITGNTTQGNLNNGIFLVSGSNNNTITGNTTQGNTGSGIYVSTSDNNTITGNTTQGNIYGIHIFSHGNTITGNNVTSNTTYGVYLSSANNNLVSANTIYDSGSATTNNGIYVNNSDSNNISSNSITDGTGTTNCTTDCYAINVDVSSDTNYLSSNTLGNGSINDTGTGTIYGGQVNSSGNFIVQPAGTIELMKNTNITGTLNITSDVDTNGSLTVGNANQFIISNLGVVTAGTWQGGAVQDTYVADNLTISSSGTVDWAALNNYPAACAAGSAVTQLGDTVTCSAFATGTAASYIQNQIGGAQATSNFWVSGTGRADTSLQAPQFDTATGVALTLGGNATSISVVDDTVLAAGKSLTITGGITGTRPAGAEGMVYYDTTTKQLLVFANGKWQADRTEAVIVAASNSSQADKDAADYIADANTVAANDGAQIKINAALSAAAGKKVVLLAGTYTIDASISIPNNTILAGVGHDALITIPNSFNAGLDAIVNSDTLTGTGVEIRDLTLDGNEVNQTAGTRFGIFLSGMGGGSGPTARQGARLTGLWVNNWGNGISLDTTLNTSVSDNVLRGNVTAGIELYGSSTNTVSDNLSQGNGYVGISLGTGSQDNAVSNNSLEANGTVGISVDTDSNTISSNVITAGIRGMDITGNKNLVESNSIHNTTSYGVWVAFLNSSNTVIGNNLTLTGGVHIEDSNNNTIVNNTINDSNGSTDNSAITMFNSDNNTISNNTISDPTHTATNYAIDVNDAASGGNIITGNTLYDGTINDTGTGTVYGGQVNSAGNYLLQPSGSIELLKNTNITGNLAATGTLQGTQLISTVATGTAPLTVSSTTLVANLNSDKLDGQDGSFYQNASNINAGTLAVANGGSGAGTFTQYGVLFGNGTGAFGVTAAGSTGQCLLATTSAAPTWGACTPTNLQGTYNASSGVSLIDLTDAKDFTITATDQTTDPSIVFNLNCTTCSANGGRFAIQDAGVDIFRINPNGDIIVGTASNNVTFTAASGYQATVNGNARNTKVIRLTAEYPGAVLDAVNDTTGTVNCSTNFNGTMTSGYDQTNRKNYYNWTSSQAGAQCYDVVVQIPIPSDFSDWTSTTPISVDLNTDSTANGQYALELRNSSGTAETSATWGTIGTLGSTGWTTVSPATVAQNPSSGYTAGDHLTLRIRLSAKSNANIKVGNITLSYKSKF